MNVRAGERQEEIESSEDPVESTTGLRELATAESGVRQQDGADMSGIGRQWK